MKNIIVSILFALSVSYACASSTDIVFSGTCGKAYLYHFLNRASAYGDEAGVKILLDQGADPNGSDYTNYPDCIAPIEFSTPLYVAAYGGHINTAKLLIEAGANPNILEGEGVTSLIAAIRSGNVEMVKLLLKHGAKQDIEGLIFKPSDVAKRKGNKEILLLLGNN